MVAVQVTNEKLVWFILLVTVAVKTTLLYFSISNSGIIAFAKKSNNPRSEPSRGLKSNDFKLAALTQETGLIFFSKENNFSLRL